MADKEWWETCSLDEWLYVEERSGLSRDLLKRARAQEARIAKLEEPLEYDERAELLERKQAQLKVACALNGEYETRIRELEAVVEELEEELEDLRTWA